MELQKELLFSKNPVPMLFYSTDGTVIEVNEAFSDRFLNSSDIVGCSLDDLTQPLPTDLFSTGQDQNGDREYLSLQLPSGGNVWVELISKEIVLDNKQALLGTVNELFSPINDDQALDHPIFKSIFNKALDIILVADDDGNFVQANDTACQKLGYSKEELLDMGIPDITHGPIHSYGNKQWNDFIRTGTDEGEYLLETKDGTILTVEYRAVANIRPGNHLSILRDVTAEEELKQLDKLKSKAIETSLTGKFFTDKDFSISYVNQSCLDMWEYETKDEMVEHAVSSFFKHPDQFPKIKQELLEEGEWHGQLTAQKKDKTEFQVEVSINSIVGNGEKPVIWVGSAMDISDQLEIEESLRYSNNRFHRLLESAPDAILVINQNGIINFCNSQTEKMMGYEEGELIGQPVEKLVPNSIRSDHKKYRNEYIEDPHKRPMGSDIELKAVRKDGSTFPVDIMLGPLDEKEGPNIVAIIRDISGFKNTERKLEREKNFSNLLQRSTAVANQAQSFNYALKENIRNICEFMEWPVGHVYLPANDGTGEFYPTKIWHIENNEKFESFRELTMKTRLSPEMGMVGQVISSGKPQWYMNAHKNPEFVRQLPDEDLNIRACFGLPILVEKQVVGVLEFFSPKVLPGDAVLLKRMATIGNQLGRIVERKRSKEKLKRSQTKFKTLFDTALDAILILDDNQLIDCNKSAAQLFDCSKNELLNTFLDSLLPERQPNGITSKHIALHKINSAIKGKNQSFEWRFKKSDGTEFDAAVNLIHMKMGGKSFVQAIIRDITEQKEAERLIHKNMELFAQLFENAPIGIVMLDESGRIERTNRSFEDTFGYTLSEIRGKKIDHFMIPESKQEEAYAITEQTFVGDSHQTETVRIAKDGEEIPVMLASVPVTLKDKTIAIFGIYVDISERKKAEQQLRQSLEEKKVLLQEIHHRVKNNLAVITGLLELQIHGSENRKVIQELKDSQSRIYSMATVHEQLYQLDSFSLIEVDTYIKDLSKTISRTFTDLSTEVTFDFQTESISLTLNQAIPCGLLLNELITNAFKHAFIDKNKGTIKIILQESREKVKLIVSDDGPGIPDEMINSSGNSLGMSLINTFVKQLDGELDIDNQNGSTFTICFPRNAKS